jgi:hypothetical protein
MMKQNPQFRNQLMKSLGTDDIDLANQRMQKNQQFVQQLAPDGSNLQDIKKAAINAGLAKEWNGVPDYGGVNTVWAIKQGSQSLANQIDNHMAMVKMKNERFMKGIEKGQIPPEFLPGGQEPAGLGTGQQTGPQGQMTAPQAGKAYTIPGGQHDADAQKAYDDALGSRKQNDPAYATAGSNLLAVKNAMSIFDKHPDLSELNTQDQHILAGEAAKAIKGGASPSKDEVEALLPQNLASRGADLWAKISSKPIPTNNAEYYQQLKDYFGDLRENSMNTIRSAHDYAAQTAVARGIAPESLAIKQKAAEKELRDLAYGQKSKPSNSNAHPHDDAAISWARKNPGAMADAIFKANGVSK